MKYFYLGDDFMPGYVTHYIFGRDMYEKLSDPVLKNNLYKTSMANLLMNQETYTVCYITNSLIIMHIY